MSRPTSKERQLAAAKKALYHIMEQYPDSGAARVAQGTLAHIAKIKAQSAQKEKANG